MAKRALIVILLTIAPMISGCSAEAAALLVSYHSGPAVNEITIKYLKGATDSPGRLEILEETSAKVAVKVVIRGDPGGDIEPMIGDVREVVGTLTGPLGDRRIVDEMGIDIPPG
ncbi:hypothetical protein Aca07nite_88170 [Actinoplanes capillaceus]|uniref:Uncharacterized protein n=1 Tax=Actinoplanes campanulatus TaxID=113559 RepID=A0ABQ3WZA5_9ACTN|nr:hypothetical protein [Actinoplanes capillaceus]GID51542.1 hypothetical protein Aca07nite_88170 [Actinoplanes capillaceus]